MCEARIEELLVEIRGNGELAQSAAPKRLPARNIRSLKIGPVRVADQETALRHSPLTALRRLEAGRAGAIQELITTGAAASWAIFSAAILDCGAGGPSSGLVVFVCVCCTQRKQRAWLGITASTSVIYGSRQPSRSNPASASKASALRSRPGSTAAIGDWSRRWSRSRAARAIVLRHQRQISLSVSIMGLGLSMKGRLAQDGRGVTCGLGNGGMMPRINRKFPRRKNSTLGVDGHLALRG